MIWNWQLLGEELPFGEHRAEELWIFVNAKHPKVVKSHLAAKSFPSLQQNIEGLDLLIGFNDQNGHKPFVILQWEDESRPLLEKRWSWGKALHRLKSIFKVKDLTFFLSQGDRIYCEDMYTTWLDPATEHFPYESFKVYALDPFDKKSKEIDECRFQYRRSYASWINENPDSMTSLEIGRRLSTFAASHSCQFEELDVPRLEKEGMNLLLAVGQASERSPSRCFLLSHNFDGKKAPLMLVGKGITFDTGGINVKPFEGHVNAMKNDMGGAALMANLFMALVELGYEYPLVLVIPACENLVAEKAMKPGSLIRSHKGLQVMIEHTDAEGRLILADAISYGQSKFHPSLTMTAATLTTAALRQFTNYITPVHFAHPDLQDKLIEAGKRFGERYTFWDDFRPFRKANLSKFGDLTNMGRLPNHANIGGGSNVAAHFLREFSSSPLVHLDIFATAWNWSGDYPGCGFGATGAPFNSLFQTIFSAQETVWGG